MKLKKRKSNLDFKELSTRLQGLEDFYRRVKTENFNVVAQIEELKKLIGQQIQNTLDLDNKLDDLDRGWKRLKLKEEHLNKQGNAAVTLERAERVLERAKARNKKLSKGQEALKAEKEKIAK